MFSTILCSVNLIKKFCFMSGSIISLVTSLAAAEDCIHIGRGRLADRLRTVLADRPRTILPDRPRTIFADRPRTVFADRPRTVFADRLGTTRGQAADYTRGQAGDYSRTGCGLYSRTGRGQLADTFWFIPDSMRTVQIVSIPGQRRADTRRTLSRTTWDASGGHPEDIPAEVLHHASAERSARLIRDGLDIYFLCPSGAPILRYLVSKYRNMFDIL